MTRLLLDVSSLTRWTGPPVGIVRVEHALARAARSRPDTTLCVWDKRARGFRALRPDWAETVLGWGGAIDVPARRQSRFSRQPLFSALERVRLTSPVPGAAVAAGWLQDALLAPRRHGHRQRDAAGRRIAHVPAGLALGGDAGLGRGDVLFSAGSDWFHLEAAELGALKQRQGFRYAAMCYDLIPLTHPQFYAPAEVALVREHWRAALPLADLVIANAHCIAADVARFCRAEGLPPPQTAVLPLGYDPPRAGSGPLPAPLEPNRYALFVSTIEPRKGHAMLLRVWRRLLARGVPQRQRFRLVFAGRAGWMVDDVLAQLAGGAGLEGTVLHLTGLGDDALHGLYTHAAFAVYPSQYEGFGLPVVEAFAHGKPVLASTGGALPETVAGACPCLAPDDEDEWETALAGWIEHPEQLSGFQAPGSLPGWEKAAADILDRAAAL